MAVQDFLQRIEKLWTGWEIQVLVVLSLFLQIILIIFGARRKSVASNWINILVWLAYLSADNIATLALGNLVILYCRDDPLKPDFLIKSFWAPFLLLHLGGPDTITAYSLEDNELWRRHFLNLIVQSGIAFYILFSSLGDSILLYLAIPIFLAGVIKYGERTWVLRSSSTKCFRDSLMSDPYPGPYYFEILENPRQYGVKDDSRVLIEKKEKEKEDDEDDARVTSLYQAWFLFQRFKYIFADLVLGYYERVESYSKISDKSPQDAFTLIEIELGFLYDVLYTKANTVYSWLGMFLRCITFLSSTSALLVFSILIDKHRYSRIDISITYMLLVGAVALEIHAFIKLVLSDWADLWLALNCTTGKHLSDRKRWSGSMGQYNLLKYCLQHQTRRLPTCLKSIGIDEVLENHLNIACNYVNRDMQELIFNQLIEKSKEIKDDLYNSELCKKLLAQRGDGCDGGVPQKRECLDNFRWSTVNIEFHHSLLLWHIATELCYQSEIKNHGDNPTKECRISKGLSDYMMYLLIMRPKMLPKGIGKIIYRDTCAEAARFFNRMENHLMDKACEALLEVDVASGILEEKKGNSKSVLFYGCKLAKQLQGLDHDSKWKIISEVWVEMLSYAASHCEWKEHGKQLSKGGEFITHVCLLMVHLGLSEQYQIGKQRIAEKVYDLESPFYIARTRNASHERLRRWRQAAPVLNASRRFRYTLDLRREEEKRELRSKTRAHAQAIRAAYLFSQAGNQANGTS